MKKIIVFILFSSLLIASCETFSDLEQGVSSLSGKISDSSSGTATGAIKDEVDFRDKEVLCSVSKDASKKEAYYLPALILTEPSSATANQAEVMFANGKKDWTHIVLPSRKAQDDDLKIGGSVLFMFYQSDDEDMTEEKYRTNEWQFGNVTSTTELFKGVVEVDGRSVLVKWVRIAE